MFGNLLNQLSEKIKSGISVILPNSQEVTFGQEYGAPAFKIVINNKKALRALASGDELKIAEAYIYGDLDLRGEVDMLKLLEITRYFSQQHPFIIKWSRLISFFTDQIAINKKSISFHYEFDNDFYLLFLDKTRTYSHGIFLNDDEPYEQAAARKLEFALQSCHLQAGDRVLDIGSGWGNIVEYLGTRGINVDAVTLSSQSEKFIAKLIQEKQLSHCRIFRKDFLEYQLPQGQTYDALFSLGTLEHLPDYKRAPATLADASK